MAYVYRHIRLDKNEPFYIGISDRKRRANDGVGSSRNRLWRFIISKTDYEVEIMFDDISYEDAKNKEVEFIKLYGRIDLGTGTLANLTNGGDGRLIHGRCSSTLFNMWSNIMRSCYDPKSNAYRLYGALGIGVCDEWKNDITLFSKWCFENGIGEKLVLSRKNKELNYSPDNCVFITSKESANKKSTAFKIKFNDDVYSKKELAEKIGMPYQLFLDRYKRGWDINKIVATPLNINKRNKATKPNKIIYNGYTGH